MSIEAVRESLFRALPAMRSPVLMGIGNMINADDGIGPFIVSRLSRRLRSIRALDVGAMPENFATKVASMKPSHVIVLDAAMLDGPPGTVGLVSIGEVDELIFTTHHIPLGRTLERIGDAWPCELIIIGIKPGTMETGAPMTRAVRESADGLAQLFHDLDSELAAHPGLDS